MDSQSVRNECRGLGVSNGTVRIDHEKLSTEISVSGNFFCPFSDTGDFIGDIPSSTEFSGTCDPIAGTFSIPYTTPQGTSAKWEGHWESWNRIAGTRKSTGGCYFEISWTAELLFH
jgi:hypothetical protein